MNANTALLSAFIRVHGRPFFFCRRNVAARSIAAGHLARKILPERLFMTHHRGDLSLVVAILALSVLPDRQALILLLFVSISVHLPSSSLFSPECTV